MTHDERRSTTVDVSTTSLGQHLLELRKAAGWSQDDLATRIGYTQTAISLWERGLRAPSVVALAMLALAFETPLDELAAILANDNDEELDRC